MIWKEFNWGHGLIIFFILFIGLLVTVLIKSMQMDHSLVATDYYAQDLAYQNKYEKLVNANDEGKDFDLVFDEKSDRYLVQFNDQNQKTGILYFYRPADQRLDYKIKFQSGEQIVVDQKIVDGRWKISIDWNDLDTQRDYFKEKEFYLVKP